MFFESHHAGINKRILIKTSLKTLQGATEMSNHVLVNLINMMKNGLVKIAKNVSDFTKHVGRNATAYTALALAGVGGAYAKNAPADLVGISNVNELVNEDFIGASYGQVRINGNENYNTPQKLGAGME